MGKLLDTITTISDGTATYTLTGTGRGKRYFYTKIGTIQSEIHEIIDAIYYDPCTSDTSSRYYADTGNNNSIEYDSETESIRFTCGTNNGRRYTMLDTGANNPVIFADDYKGKTIRFTADVNPSRSCAVSILQVIPGVSPNPETDPVWVTGQTTTSIVSEIASNATRVQFRIRANGDGATTGDTVDINNITITEEL